MIVLHISMTSCIKFPRTEVLSENTATNDKDPNDNDCVANK